MSMEMALCEAVDDRRRDEREVFGKITRALEEVSASAAGDPAREAALHGNFMLWSVLQENLCMEDNQLPETLKQQLIGLASWVEGYTAKLRDGVGSIGALISVNNAIMEGLV